MIPLVLIHGRDTTTREPAAMKARWLTVLDAGLRSAGSDIVITDDDAALVHYGATLASLVTEPGEEPPPVTTHAMDDGRLELALAVALEVLRTAEVPSEAAEIVAAEAAAVEQIVARGEARDRLAEALARALGSIDRHVPGLSGAVVLWLARDVHTYLNVPRAREIVDAGVAAAVPDGPSVVVAHSLGSVIAFETLRGPLGVGKDVTLITLGSPLAIRAVSAALRQPVGFPTAVRRWVAARDLRDVLTLTDLTSMSFPMDPPGPGIEVLRASNEAPGHHAAAVLDGERALGYLADAGVARMIGEAVIGRQ